ncbi:MAG: hypothetical protein MMC33_003222 [Icmadophila ericetorum]|nr:hypothetical protein [Icmadophila ericetorum]
MTDLSSSLTTQTAPSVDPSADTTSGVHLLHNAISDGPIVEDEEDYTIKCICDFQEDDGHTVLCEKCETWQHIECYYSPNPVPEVHICADCDPKSEHAKRAQRKRQNQPDNGDRKVLKTKTKSHKRKIKVPEEHSSHANGYSHEKHGLGSPRNGVNGSSKDHAHPAKKSKTSHRPSQSMHNLTGPLLPPSQSSKRSASSSHIRSPSTTTPNGYHSDQYSPEFLQLYNNDPGATDMEANLFNDIDTTNDLSKWSQDVEALSEATGGKKPQEIFNRMAEPLATYLFPELHQLDREDPSADYDGHHPRWKYLSTNVDLPQNYIVAELRGKIGDIKDYVKDPTNRWDYLRHPLPFVFFHDHLPIYIDTRREGNSCRYIRRSCRPNLIMKTFLENNSEYHFCFLASQDLKAGAELTTGWRFDEHITHFLQQQQDAAIKQEVASEAESYVSDWVGKVLADFGGCACSDPAGCRMAPYDRRGTMFSTEGVNGISKKGYSHASHSTGPPTNSRSGSEALKNQDGEDQDDNRSTSGSTRSKPRSRDMTPSHQASNEKGTTTGVELSDREKRKIAAMEKNFEQLEQDKPHKKKKRPSGGSNLNTPVTSSNKYSSHSTVTIPQSNTPGFSSRTGRRRSGSPSKAVSRPNHADSTPPEQAPRSHMVTLSTSLGRKKYVDCSVQVDMDMEDIVNGPPPPLASTRQTFMSFPKRMWLASQKHRALVDQARETWVAQAIRDQEALKQSTVGEIPADSIKDGQPIQGDVEMQDVIESTTVAELPFNPPVQKPRPPDDPDEPMEDAIDSHDPVFKPPPSPRSLHNGLPPDRKPLINGYRSADLHVQLPPKQLFNNDPSTPTVGTPNATSSLIAQSPTLMTPTPGLYPSLSSSSSSMIQPSPVKKKISFGEYSKYRRNSHKPDTPAIEKNDQQFQSSSPTTALTPDQVTKPLESVLEEVREKDHPMDGSAVPDIPKLELRPDAIIAERDNPVPPI